METPLHFWPEKNRCFWDKQNPRYILEINWGNDPFDMYKSLASKYARCGFAAFDEIIRNAREIRKTDMWFYAAVYLVRQSLELGLKASICRVLASQKNGDVILATLKGCGHRLLAAFDKYEEYGKENNLFPEEERWLKTYLVSVDKIDPISDTFRFPFNENFLDQFQNKLLNVAAVAKNLSQAVALVEKCLNGGKAPGFQFDNSLEPEYLVQTGTTCGGCRIWQPTLLDGFYPKIIGYRELADYLFDCDKIALTDKAYPLFFLLRNALELYLKRLEYYAVRTVGNVDALWRVLFDEKREHKLTNLWRKNETSIKFCTTDGLSEQEIIEVAEQHLKELDKIDADGKLFSFPTTLKNLSGRYNGQKIDAFNVFEMLRSLVCFFECSQLEFERRADQAQDVYELQKESENLRQFPF